MGLIMLRPNARGRLSLSASQRNIAGWRYHAKIGIGPGFCGHKVCAGTQLASSQCTGATIDGEWPSVHLSLFDCRVNSVVTIDIRADPLQNNLMSMIL